MDKRIVQFIAALRAAGVRVSLSESADAFSAIENLGIADREVFKIALRSTLVKESKDLPEFDKLFPLFFQSLDAPPMMNAAQDLTPEEAQKIAAALKSYADHLRNMLEKLLSGQPLSSQELRDFEQMIDLKDVNDLRYQNFMARQMEKAMQFREVKEALEDLMSALRQMGMNKERVEQLQKMMEANQQTMRDQIARHIGQRIAENMSEQSRRDRQDNLFNQPFQSLSDDDMRELRREVRRLASAMRTRLALRLKRAKSGRLDVKSTLRANQKYGALPIDLRHRDRTLKPRIVVICDISTSMRHVSELMLSLLFAIQDQISKTHAFAFIDHLKYITPFFEGQQPSDAIAEILKQMPSGYYNTNLGSSLSDFNFNYLDMLDHRTTLIFVGDARNNYNDPRLELFRGLTRRARATIWLNPEALLLWGTGDSDMGRYAPLCSRVFQVNNLQQLADAVDHLLLGD